MAFNTFWQDNLQKTKEEGKMKRDLWKAIHRCIKCDDVMEKKIFTIEGIKIRGWECSKCKETVLHPEDSQKMFIFNKLKKGLSVKVGELGKSLIVRIPREVAEFYNISKGREIKLKADTFNKMELDTSKTTS